MSEGTASSGEAPHPDIRVLGGDPDSEELAAISAVLAAALDEYAASARRVETLGQSSSWRRAQLRAPLLVGQWRRSGWN